MRPCETAGSRSKAIDPDHHPSVPTHRNRVAALSAATCSKSPSVAVSAENGRFDMKKWGREGIPTVTPLWLLKYLPNMLACHIGIIHDIQGPSNTITSGEVSSHIAVTEAAEMIQRGHADVVLAGGGEAKVNPLLMVRQCLLKRSTFSGNDNPQPPVGPSTPAPAVPFQRRRAACVLKNSTKKRILYSCRVCRRFLQRLRYRRLHHLKPRTQLPSKKHSPRPKSARPTGLIIPHSEDPRSRRSSFKKYQQPPRRAVWPLEPGEPYRLNR